MAKKKQYGVAETSSTKPMPAPALPYLPRDPRKYRPNIGLIGCGGITGAHLAAYKKAGYNVVALCDLDPAKSEARRKEFFPEASTYTNHRDVLKRDDIEVVDIATHPHQRVKLLVDALNARKHVLSQKPFVLDLDFGQRLVDLAAKKNVRLAVNQNGRWAPHFSYIRHAIDRGLIGDLSAAHLSVHWNHNWVAGGVFDKVRHLVLWDFGIHWFDQVARYFGQRTPKRVFASIARSRSQSARPAMLGQVLIEFPDAQATLAFDADTYFGQQDRTFVTGSKGTLYSVGIDLNQQQVTLSTAKGIATPVLQGSWFTNGFHGTMAELLCAVEEKREPENAASNNLRGLAICYAAVKSADTGKPVKPGSVRKMRP